jgi:co-chaperonin GroES (HSP10)
LALIDPIVVPPSGLVTLTDRQVPMIGRVVRHGATACPECGAANTADLAVGAIVLVPPTSGQEITVDDHAYWMVPIADLLAEWRAPV